MVTEARRSKCTITATAFLIPNTHRGKPMAEMTKNELVHSTRGEFINNSRGAWGARKGRVIRLSNANNVQQKHLTILLRQDRPAHRHAHPKKEMDPPGLYLALQLRRIVRLRVRTASARLVFHTFPELQSTKAWTRGVEPRGGETR